MLPSTAGPLAARASSSPTPCLFLLPASGLQSSGLCLSSGFPHHAVKFDFSQTSTYVFATIRATLFLTSTQIRPELIEPCSSVVIANGYRSMYGIGSEISATSVSTKQKREAFPFPFMVSLSIFRTASGFICGEAG